MTSENPAEHTIDCTPGDRPTLAVVEPKPRLTATEYLDRLEACGGNLVLFCSEFSPEESKYHPRWLYEVYVQLSREEQRRWQASLRLGAEIRLDFLQAKALDKLEDDDNVTPARTGYTKVILDELLVARAERQKKAIAFPYQRKLAEMRKGGATTDGADDEEETEAEKDEVDRLLDEESA